MLPHFDLGGSGPPLHFLHANGYPPECYTPLLELLQTKYRVFGMYLRALWPDSKPEEIKKWAPFTEDLLRFLSDRRTGPVIGAGHSIGAIVTLRAALRDPAKFRALVLIDPVLFTPPRLLSWNFVRAIGLGYKLHPKISGALKRRRTFDSLELAFRGYRGREVFRYLTDDNLRIYIEGITKPSPNGGYELVFSPEWETQIYYTGLRDFDLWRGLKRLQIPTLFIRGAESDTFLEKSAKLVRRKQPKVRIEAVEKSTHLVPLERPKEVYDIIQSFLKENL